MPHQSPAQTRQFADLIGNTPLVYLRGASELTGCHIYGKAEFLNPGGSVKDRTALGIVRAAEASGELQAGGTIVEGTAGNTGIGLTLLANSLGYKSVVVMPQSLSKEKIELLDLYGADLRLVKATSYDDPNHYIHTAERLAKELSAKDPNGVVWARQFDNTANRDIHYQTTGAEIWDQTDGKVDGFICAVGTGGTLAGTAMALRERNAAVKIGLADPQGSALFSHYTNGELNAEGRSIAEGIGISFVTGNLQGIDIDMPYQISDAEALPHIFNMLRHEGLCLGGSSAINIAGAVRMAQDMGPGHTIVTILCDYGDRYKSKLYNPVYLEQVDLPVPDWLRI
ncbi:cysteine synthase A [Litorivivens sp.]|uniref:cysteine synthase A n=1 Tax=Litorivivens sp. TaxID=2020868 RepID=UPI003564601D